MRVWMGREIHHNRSVLLLNGGEVRGLLARISHHHLLEADLDLRENRGVLSRPRTSQVKFFPLAFASSCPPLDRYKMLFFNQSLLSIDTTPYCTSTVAQDISILFYF
jgi:hypothetical protein